MVINFGLYLMDDGSLLVWPTNAHVEFGACGAWFEAPTDKKAYAFSSEGGVTDD